MNDAAATPLEENRVYAKVTRRLVPFLFCFYVVGYLDRVNIGFAKLQMLADLGWNDTIYGFGAGMFFIGYFFFEMPGNLIMYKVGARRWIASIMVVWGLISASMMFVSTVPAFYALRFCLGVAEAGFFPGIILYLTYWYPLRRRGKIIALFMTAIGFSGVLGGPISGLIMEKLQGVAGLSGWKWLFALEGLPAAAMGLLVLFIFDDTVRQTHWLDDREKSLLETNVERESAGLPHLPIAKVMVHPRIWYLAAILFFLMIGLYGVGFWLPQLIRNAGFDDMLHVGLISAIPYGAAVIAMVLVGRHSDQTGERRRHIALSAFAGAVGLALAGLCRDNAMLTIAALALGVAGTLTTVPIFLTLPTEFLGGIAAAAGIGLVNAVGNLGGFASPALFGIIQDRTHDPALSLYAIAICLIFGGLLALALPPSARPAELAS